MPQYLRAERCCSGARNYQANGRLHVTAKVKGHAATVAADFQRENSLPDEDLELWRRFVREEIAEVPD